MLGKAIRQLRIQENPSTAGSHSAPANPLVGGEGLAAPSPRTPSPALGPSALASPTPTPKWVPTPLNTWVWQTDRQTDTGRRIALRYGYWVASRCKNDNEKQPNKTTLVWIRVRKPGQASKLSDFVRFQLGMGGATDFKVGGTKQDSRAERAKKSFVPPLFQMWGYKQANINRDLLNILKFAVWL